jgi:hypothetical protein
MRPSNPHTSLFRWVHTRPGGLDTLMNLVRAAKVRSTADLALLSDLVPDARPKLLLSRHAQDEARHACRLLEAMARLGCRAARLPEALDPAAALLQRNRARDVRQVHADRGLLTEAETMELAITTLVAERDMLSRALTTADVLAGTPGGDLLREVVADDVQHAQYLSEWLESFERRFSRRAVSAAQQRLEALLQDLAAGFEGAVLAHVDAAAA